MAYATLDSYNAALRNRGNNINPDQTGGSAPNIWSERWSYHTIAAICHLLRHPIWLLSSLCLAREGNEKALDIEVLIGRVLALSSMRGTYRKTLSQIRMAARKPNNGIRTSGKSTISNSSGRPEGLMSASDGGE
jgi:hypothetical protein